MLLGTMHPATFLKNGKVCVSLISEVMSLSLSKLVDIPKGGDILTTVEDINLFPDLPLEFFSNRDSVHYREVYNIPEATTIVRSTMRYRGFCGIARGLLRLGLLADTEHQRLQPDAAPLRWVSPHTYSGGQFVPYICSHALCYIVMQRDLLAILISQSDVRTPDLRSSVLEAVGGDEKALAAIEELVHL